MPGTPRLTAVNVVHQVLPSPKSQVKVTAIDKRPQAGPVAVGELGLAGDTQCDTKHHGGPDQALYLYAREDADWWATELARQIPPGLFGENLSTEGLDVTGALIGERWRLGETVEVEVRTPRTPCITFQSRMDIPHWIKRFHQAGRPGAYLKVLRTGPVTAGDRITIVHRPDHGVTVGRVFADPDPAAMQALLDSGIDLAESMRELAVRVAGRG